MGLLGTQLVCKLILAVLTRDVGGVNFAATMLEFSILWGGTLLLERNLEIYDHTKLLDKNINVVLDQNSKFCLPKQLQQKPNF